MFQLGFVIWALFRENPYKQLLSKYAVAAPVLFLTLIILARSMFYLVFGQDSELWIPHTILDAWFLVFSMLVIITTSIGFMWMNVQRVDIELESHVKEVEAGYELVDAIFNTAPIPVFHKDAEGRYKKVNKTFLELLGVTTNQVIDMSVHEVDRAVNAKLVDAKDELVLQTGESITYENRVRFNDGLYHNVLVNKGAIIDRKGNVVGIVGTMSDITESKIYEAKIKHLAMY